VNSILTTGPAEQLALEAAVPRPAKPRARVHGERSLVRAEQLARDALEAVKASTDDQVLIERARRDWRRCWQAAPAHAVSRRGGVR
jgi:hypothetical protein